MVTVSKRGIILLVVIALTSSSVFAADAPSSWAVNTVNQLKSIGIIRSSLFSGYQAKATRLRFTQAVSDLAVHYAKKIGRPYSSYSPLQAFSDCSDADVRRSHFYGIVGGSNGCFYPNDAITRQEAFTILYRMLKYMSAFDLDTHGVNGLLTFSDNSKIASWARDATNALVLRKIVNGNSDGTINPTGLITNEEMLQMLLNTYKKFHVFAESSVSATDYFIFFYLDGSNNVGGFFTLTVPITMYYYTLHRYGPGSVFEVQSCIVRSTYSYDSTYGKKIIVGPGSFVDYYRNGSKKYTKTLSSVVSEIRGRSDYSESKELRYYCLNGTLDYSDGYVGGMMVGGLNYVQKYLRIYY